MLLPPSFADTRGAQMRTRERAGEGEYGSCNGSTIHCVIPGRRVLRTGRGAIDIPIK